MAALLLSGGVLPFMPSPSSPSSPPSGSSALAAQEATAVYTEGWVDKKSGVQTSELFIGDPLRRGDTVITGADGYAELEMENRSSVRISGDTVFEIREIQSGDRKESVLACTAGRVAFKFNRMAREPRIATASLAGGVRGTEFTLYSGSDGSAFVAVDSGRVDISSAGETVSLTAQEGVEVLPGEPPGEKISLLEKEMDFAAWSREKKQQLLADPQTGLDRAEAQLREFYRQIRLLRGERAQLMEEKAPHLERMNQLREAGGKEAVSPYYKEHVKPIESDILEVNLNVRYYALSALSLRRNVLGPLYMEMKSRHILDRRGETWIQFDQRYSTILKAFRERVYPYLVPPDM